MPFSAYAIANEFLDLATAARSPLTPMKVQKLVYFAHGWHLAIEDQPLINESVEAWRWGPVVPSLWGELKEFGNRSIDRKIVSLSRSVGDKLSFTFYEPSIEATDDGSGNKGFAKALVGKIWEKYGALSAVQLSNMTHEPGTPWHQVWMPMAGNPIKRKDIPNDVIRDYFRARAGSR